MYEHSNNAPVGCVQLIRLLRCICVVACCHTPHSHLGPEVVSIRVSSRTNQDNDGSADGGVWGGEGGVGGVKNGREVVGGCKGETHLPCSAD